MKKNKNWIELGEEKYDRFIKKLGYTDPVTTPHTAKLETLGGLVEDSNTFIRVASKEFVSNFDL